MQLTARSGVSRLPMRTKSIKSMVKVAILGIALTLITGLSFAQQSPCDLISDQQLAELHIDRSFLSNQTIQIPKEIYGTSVELIRNNCFYKVDSSSFPYRILVSLITLGNKNDVEQVQTALSKIHRQVQTIGEASPAPLLKLSMWDIRDGWCSSNSTAPGKFVLVAGCSGMRQGRFLSFFYSEDSETADKAFFNAQAQKYFEMILAKAIVE